VADKTDLPLRGDEPMGPLGDFDLGEASRPPAPVPGVRGRRRHDPDFDPRVTPPGQARARANELPLFVETPRDETPLVRPAAAEAPLSVRRSTPPAAKARPRPTPRPIEPETPQPELLPMNATDAVLGPPAQSAEGSVAGVASRVGAAVLDWLLLTGLDIAVVYFTLRVCRLDSAELSVLPWIPMAGFLLLLNGGYLSLLTAASGQTIGKMAFGLRVVSGDDQPLAPGQAVLRTIVFLVSAAPAGLGLLPALFDHARRGLHDRLARTRVVHS
jgi:uncharacterized RDD family membrane protein YckC